MTLIQPISRWSTEHRAAKAQRDRLCRFLIESCLFAQPQLLRDLRDATGVTLQPTQAAQAAGYQPRWWLANNRLQQDLRWRWPKPAPEPKPKWEPPDLPGVSKAEISRALGVTREAVRQHALRPGFPPPLPLTHHRDRYDPGQIQQYYRDCHQAHHAKIQRRMNDVRENPWQEA